MKFQLERILLFSDAVFAIAITLMIIEVKPPHLGDNISFSNALKALLEKLPIFLGTIISFYMIALYWYKHHDLMQHVTSYDAKFILLNFSLLLSVAFIPFSTSFVFENLAAASPLPLLFYNVNHIITCLLNYRICNYSLDPANKLAPVKPVQALLQMKHETLYWITVFVIIIVIAFINPQMAPIGYALFGFQDVILKRFQKKVKK